MDKEKRDKNDKRDSRKIARELEHGSLQAIYTPDRFHQEFRSLCRLREREVSQGTRLKNRITGYLAFYGIHVPSQEEMPHWSGRFIKWLKTQSLQYSSGNHALSLMIEDLLYQRSQLLRMVRLIREEVRAHPESARIIALLETIPGVGFITALTFYSEIIDMKRFSHFDRLKSFVGLAPETVIQKGLTQRHNRHLRYVLVESAWVAIRNDPALLQAYHPLLKRMKPQQAIIRMAAKLLSRIRYVWLNQKPYVIAVVK
jgi:transposase